MLIGSVNMTVDLCARLAAAQGSAYFGLRRGAGEVPGGPGLGGTSVLEGDLAREAGPASQKEAAYSPPQSPRPEASSVNVTPLFSMQTATVAMT